MLLVQFSNRGIYRLTICQIWGWKALFGFSHWQPSGFEGSRGDDRSWIRASNGVKRDKRDQTGACPYYEENLQIERSTIPAQYLFLVIVADE